MNLIWQTIAVIVFAGSCWALGDLILKLFFSRDVNFQTVTRYTLAFVTGNVAFSHFITGLGFLGLFTSGVLWTVFIVCSVLILWRVGVEVKRSLGRKDQVPKSDLFPAPDTQKGSRESQLAAFLLIVIIALFYIPVILQAAAPPYLRDSLVYHLLCPKAYLKAGGLVHISGNIYSAFPKGHEVLMTLLLGVAGDRAAQGFSLFQQLFAISGVYGLIRMRIGPWPSMVCTIGYATVPPVVYFSGCGYVEPAFLMTLCSTLIGLAIFFKIAIEKPSAEILQLKIFSLVGFIAGWMVAVKYTGLIYLCLIGLILLWNQRKRSYKKALTYLGAFSLAALPGFSWMIWNWVTLGNPVYPMAWFLFGGKGLDEDLAITFSLYFDTYGMGRGFLDYLKLPWRLAFSGKFDTIFFDGAVGPFLIIFIFLALFSFISAIQRPPEKNKVMGVGFMLVMSSLFFVFGTQQARFWLPTQLLVCVYASPIVGMIVDWAKNKRLMKAGLILIMAFSLSWNLWFFGKQFISVAYYKPVFGIEKERDFLVRKVPGYSALEFINQSLPPNSQIFCVWTGAYGYYLDRLYYTDTFVEDITLKRFINASSNGNELSRKLTSEGVTHLFLNLPLLRKNMEPNQQGIFDEFLRTETHNLFNYRNYFVFEIQTK